MYAVQCSMEWSGFYVGETKQEVQESYYFRTRIFFEDQNVYGCGEVRPRMQTGTRSLIEYLFYQSKSPTWWEKSIKTQRSLRKTTKAEAMIQQWSEDKETHNA